MYIIALLYFFQLSHHVFVMNYSWQIQSSKWAIHVGWVGQLTSLHSDLQNANPCRNYTTFIHPPISPFPPKRMTDEKSSSLTLDRSEVWHNEAELVATHGVDAAVHADLDPLPLLLRKEKILTLKCNYLESLPSWENSHRWARGRKSSPRSFLGSNLWSEVLEQHSSK